MLNTLNYTEGHGMSEDKLPEDEEKKDAENGVNENNAEEKEPRKKNSAEEKKATRKVIFSLCYIWGVLFFLPLLMYGSDKEARRHANEGLVMLIISLAGNILFGVFMRVNADGAFGIVFGILLGLLNFGIFILAVIGIVYVVKEREEPVPLIGNITLIK